MTVQLGNVIVAKSLLSTEISSMAGYGIRKWSEPVISKDTVTAPVYFEECLKNYFR